MGAANSKSRKGFWRSAWPLSGDGDLMAADPEDPKILYARARGGPSIMKSVDGGATFKAATNGLSD